MLLTTVAALSIATAAHAIDLPKADPLIGDFARENRRQLALAEPFTLDDDCETRRPGYFRALVPYCATAFGAVGS